MPTRSKLRRGRRTRIQTMTQSSGKQLLAAWRHSVVVARRQLVCNNQTSPCQMRSPSLTRLCLMRLLPPLSQKRRRQMPSQSSRCLVCRVVLRRLGHAARPRRRQLRHWLSTPLKLCQGLRAMPTPSPHRKALRGPALIPRLQRHQKPLPLKLLLRKMMHQVISRGTHRYPQRIQLPLQ